MGFVIMRYQKLFLVAFVVPLFFGAACKADGQWVRTNGPAINVHTNRTVAVLGESGSDDVAVTTNDSLFISHDGLTWSKATAPSSSPIRFLATDITNLFAITSGGIFLTTDDCASWTEASNGLTNLDVRAFAVNGGNVFAGTINGGVFISTNNGTSWTQANSGIPNSTIQALAAVGFGSTMLAGTQYGGVFSSTNNGTTWNAANTGLTSVGVNAFGVNGSNALDEVAFAATADKGVFVSTDQGANWSPANNGLSSNAVFAFATNGSNTFAATQHAGVFLTTNNGNAWSAVNTGLSNTNISGLFAAGGNYLFAVTSDGGVLLSTNNGSNWTPVDLGHDVSTYLTVPALFASGNNLFAGTSTNGVFLSTDNGNSWTAANKGIEYTGITSFATIGANLFVGTNGNQAAGGGVYLSTDEGDSWKEVYAGYSAAYIGANGTNLFVGIDSSVFLSTNNGTNWTPANTGLPGANVYTLAINGPNLFIWTYYGGVYGTTNNGTQWAPAQTDLPDESNRIGSFTWIGSTAFAGTGSNGVYSSTNNGASWLPVPQGSTPYGIQSLKAIGMHLFAGTQGALYLSDNSGTTWTQVGAGLPNAISSIDSGGANLFLGTSDGVWRRPLSEIFASSAVADRPITLSVAAQAYPNPFPEKTSINISSAESGEADITIVNLLGAPVAQLFDGELQPGPHSFTWDASGVAPGNYWCIARMGGRTERIALSVER